MPSFLERYRSGDRAGVWNDLLNMGSAVRSEPIWEDARTVARETMERARHNVALLVERLTELEYRFAFPDDVWRLPDKASLAELAAFERRHGPLPLSLYAWYEVVGSVDLRGDHPKLGFYHRTDPASAERFWSRHWYPDPLVVFPLGDQLVVDDRDEDDENRWPGLRTPGLDRTQPLTLLTLAPDAIHKADISGSQAMEIWLPSPAADALLNGSDWPGVPFVSYLRECFRWGSFPGLGHPFPWSGHQPDPDEVREVLAILTNGLLPL